MPRTKKTTESKKEKGHQAPVFDTSGKEVGKVTLPKEIFAAKVNKTLLSQAVRVYLGNQRQGTAKTKTRAEVSGGGRKPWRQKGTGRARQGSIRAPHWRGGGIVFGPKPRDYQLKLPKKMKRLALFAALTSKLNASQIKILNNLDSLQGKTKDMIKTLKNLNMPGKTLLVATTLSDKAKLSSRNIKDLKVTKTNLLTAYNILDSQNVILLKDSIKTLEDTFLKV